MNRFTQLAVGGCLLFGLLALGKALANAPAGQYTVATGTVVDNKTRLTWQRSVSTTLYNLADAQNYCSTVGAGWRLPTIKELQTLIDDSQASPPRVDSSAFPSTPITGFFLSSTIYAGGTDLVWYVNFFSGSTGYDAVQAPHNVRCVRSGTT